MTDRHLPLDGAFGFRDIGGLETSDGRSTRTGVLFRSGELSRLSVRDTERLKGLGIKTVCDLRTPNERKSKHDRLPAGVRLVQTPFYPNGGDVNRWQFFWLLSTKSRTLDFEAQIRQAYRRFAFESTAQIRRILTSVSEERELPAVLHCTAGKDRTGYVVALIQLLAGVPRDAVVADYLETNRWFAPHAGRYRKFLRWMSLFTISPERFQPLLEVRREYLEETLDEVLARHGSIEDYLTDGCGVDRSTMERLKRLLIEET